MMLSHTFSPDLDTLLDPWIPQGPWPALFLQVTFKVDNLVQRLGNLP